VATKVENHDQQATIQTLPTKSKVDDASAKIDEQFAQKHEKTEKEYVYVRQQIQPRRLALATRLLLVSLLTLSMALSACTTTPRVEFLTPTFQSAELVCEGNPKGQLPQGTTNEQASTGSPTSTTPARTAGRSSTRFRPRSRSSTTS
jgi:hypothetical protein